MGSLLESGVLGLCAFRAAIGKVRGEALMQQYLKDAMKCAELDESLRRIASDDKRAVSSYTLQEVVAEAKYVESCYTESGHSFNEELHDRDSKIRMRAWAELRKLRSFIKKYKS
jgi:hypothetical protein